MSLSKIIVVCVFIFSVLGMIDASYLTYEKLSQREVLCGEGFDCGTVLNSKWSSIGPIPLSVFGLFFYASVWLMSVHAIIETDFSRYGKRLAGFLGLKKTHFLNFITTGEVLFLLSLFGFFFSLYLVFIMGVVIQAWCAFCLFSAGTSTSIFLLMLGYWALRVKEKMQSQAYHSPFFPKSVSFAVIHFLYTRILKPIFFLMDPETVHNRMSASGQFLGRWSFTRWITRVFFSFTDPSLKKEMHGVVFPNPIGLSAGFDYNGDLTQILPSVGFGWHTIGTVTLEEYEGNEKPRLGRFPDSKALLVNKGLKSLGAKAIIKKLTPLKFEIPVGISIASTNRSFKNLTEQVENIVKCFQLFEKSKVKHSYYELNISCPNTFGGEPFFEAKRLEKLLKAVDRLAIKKPIYIKMPIDQSEKETLEMLNIIAAHKIQGVIFGNLTKDHTNPAVKPADREVWKIRKGNLSGKPTWKRSNRLIVLTKKHFKNRFTILGTGGIFSGEDAREKMRLGADLVQLITGMIFEGPQVVGEMNMKLVEKNA